ncbi:MAG: hypothetical protein PHO66_08170 [Eubacteriales bacterium]|nr:hypothetical protein [Eubacteriales bacterium]
MATFIENFGLGFLTETEDGVVELMGLIAQEGNVIVGYSGSYYLNHHFGDAQFIVRALLEEESKQISVIGLDTHSSGNSIWNCRLSVANPQPKDADPLERRVILTKIDDGSGMAVANIVNADVLPSFMEDDEVVLQMIGFPLSIDYFADEDKYADSIPSDRSGKKMLLADGSVFSSGFLHNHEPDRREEETDHSTDDYILVRGTVKNLYWGELQFGENINQHAFLRCIIETTYGSLELVHQLQAVDENCAAISNLVLSFLQFVSFLGMRLFMNMKTVPFLTKSMICGFSGLCSLRVTPSVSNTP